MRDLGKLIASKGFKKLPKVQLTTQSGHTAYNTRITDLATTPFPMPLMTPPVTKMYFILVVVATSSFYLFLEPSLGQASEWTKLEFLKKTKKNLSKLVWNIFGQVFGLFFDDFGQLFFGHPFILVFDFSVELDLEFSFGFPSELPRNLQSWE